MVNAVIFYFSGTGNTWWASEIFAGLLSQAGFNAEAVSIESKQCRTEDLLLKSSLVFLNYPVYGSDRPQIVKDFIDRLPEGNADFGIICTQLAFSGDGAWMEHNLIESKGYKIKWAVHLKMPNNISIPGFPFRWTNDRKKLDLRLEKAEKRLRLIAGRVTSGRSQLQGHSGFSHMLGLLQRAPYRRMFKKLQDDLSIDPRACTKCGRCISYCPVQNIIFAEEQYGGYPKFQGHCNLCLRCYNFCPSQAVMYRAKRFTPGTGSRRLPYQGPVEDFSPQVLRI